MIIDRIIVSHPGKIVFPATKKIAAITKAELVDYYAAIAPYMIPYMCNRPLTMVRYPSDITQEGFYQKDAPRSFPSWIKRIKVKKKQNGFTNYVVCNNPATLVYLATQNCVTPHLWLSQIDHLDIPDRMIFDLDPSVKNFELVKRTAWEFKQLLDDRQLHSFPLITGSRGMHIVIPLERKHHFDTVRAYARLLAEEFVAAYPQIATLELNKKKRGKKIFIDYLRNGFGATAVAPYAVRARTGAPVAAPVSWDECLRKSLQADSFTISTIVNRLKIDGNPWHDFFNIKNRLPVPQKVKK